ncbi:hypothetical protein ACJX0J_034517, partial [Zea mays]
CAAARSVAARSTARRTSRARLRLVNVLPYMTSRDRLKGKCSLFNGEWIPNPSGPAYTNASCRFIDDHQNCMMNGRPDKEYLHWKWKPYGCDLPPFDAVRFLDSVRNKGWGLIGDSILRNQVQSLLCLLSK